VKFFYFSIKASLAETSEYFLNMPVIFGHVIWVDDYIIQMDHNTDIQKVGKEIVYKLLEGYGSIGKTERYYKLLKWSIIYPKAKGSFLFITIGYANQVINITKIYLCIHSSIAR